MSAPWPVICLAGPTGSGKTAAALALAEACNGEIVNADSRQVYADFPLITAQPCAEEQARFAHHLYGFLPTEQKISAGAWADMATECVAAITARGRTPILVGGTGLYFRALLCGMAQIPRLDPSITAALEARMAVEGSAPMHAELASADPGYAARIHPNDRQRIVRALEVLQGTGKSFSWWHANAPALPRCTGPLVVIDADLSWLEPRLARRLDAMLEAGALDEARRALAKCDDARAPGWSGIGCAETLEHLLGRMGMEECRRQWLHNTRAYAKRQLTWFRAQKEAIFLPPDSLAELPHIALAAR